MTLRVSAPGAALSMASSLIPWIVLGRRPPQHAGKLFGVKQIVERHGGQVWADAAPGRGATFFFTLT